MKKISFEHFLNPELGKRGFRVLVIGAGGTGSSLLNHLPFLHQALLAWGFPGGLDVTVMDGDTVSETNCVRQAFSKADIGKNKATLLIHRINLFCGLEWKAVPRYFSQVMNDRSGNSIRPLSGIDLVIGCVDSRKARREIHSAVTSQNCGVSYYFDLGNSASSGQYILGQPLNGLNRRSAERLRTVAELYPEILAHEEDPQPSCSAIEALEAQEPFVNQSLAISALTLLTRLFRYGNISHQGGFWNAATGRMVPIPLMKPEPRRQTSKKTLAAA